MVTYHLVLFASSKRTFRWQIYTSLLHFQWCNAQMDRENERQFTCFLATFPISTFKLNCFWRSCRSTTVHLLENLLGLPINGRKVEDFTLFDEGRDNFVELEVGMEKVGC